MNNERFAALVTGVCVTFMKASYPSILLGITEVEFYLEAQAVIIDEFLSWQFQVGTKQKYMRVSLGR